MAEEDDIYSALADYFAVLSEPNRIKILYAISSQPKSVSEIIIAVGLTQTNVSRHLAMLYKARLVSRRKEGNAVFYQLRDPAFLDLCKMACSRIAAGINDGHALMQMLLKSAVDDTNEEASS